MSDSCVSVITRTFPAEIVFCRSLDKFRPCCANCSEYRFLNAAWNHLLQEACSTILSKTLTPPAL
ncbi:MAG TPA: hypothetical protein DGU45_10710 [Planctomycetes bacterium]|nr:hypothetical protein [Planctomycetota bacterium]